MSSKIKINKYDIQLLLLLFALFPIDIPGKIVYFIQAIFAIIIFINAFGEIRKVPMFPLVCLFPLAIIVSCVTNRNTILLTQTLRGFIYIFLYINIFVLEATKNCCIICMLFQKFILYLVQLGFWCYV